LTFPGKAAVHVLPPGCARSTLQLIVLTELEPITREL